MCLALVDHNNIPILFTYLKNRYQQQITDHASVKGLFDYYEKQWINGSPFSPIHWSCYKEEVRCTNELESWNGKIYEKGGGRSLHIYLLWGLLHRDAVVSFDRFRYELSDYTKKRQREIDAEVIDAYNLYVHNGLNPMGLLDRLVRATSKIVMNTPAEYDPADEDPDNPVEI